MIKKIISAVVSLALMVSIVFSMTMAADAWSVGEGSDYTGKDCTTNLNAASTIDYLMSKYQDGSTWTLGGECWGYAEKMNEFLAGSSDTQDYSGLKNTPENFLDKCRNIKAGTHIRFSNKKSFDGGWSGHSVVLLKVTDEKVFWADNNYDRANTVHYYSGTVDDFYMLYGQYKYITRIKETVKYKLYATAKVSSRSNYAMGHIRLTWLRTTNTEEYEVLRSYSKKGPYICIGRTSSRVFYDETIELGRTAYYKIRSVKKNGNKTSGYVYNTLRLTAPSITVTGSDNGGLTVSWDSVTGADRYKVYRSIDGGSEKLIKTTSDLFYTDKAPAEDSYYSYRVKAVCDANSKGSSAYSKAAVGRKGLATPSGLKGITDADNFVTLSWNPVKGADSYYLYCSREENGEYWLETVVYGETSYYDTVRLLGQQYYYKIAAYDSNSDLLSAPSKWILI